MPIMDFGHNSFVAVKGLKERIQEAEKEIQMRPYRGLTKEGKWVYGYFWINHYSNIHFIMQPSEKGLPHVINTPVIPETVGQFTDLKDKNGKETCKSDIIKGVHKTTGEEITSEIVWDERTFQWGVQMDDWIMGFECLINCYDIEIIGNIHQSPKLMEQE